jgi:hypothetical protein
MPPVHPGRYTAQIDGDFVVFLIGMLVGSSSRAGTRIGVAA